jgi:hypothetical protein
VGEFLLPKDSHRRWLGDREPNDGRQDRTLEVWFADLPTECCPTGSRIEFTFFWAAEQRRDGTNFSTLVVERS